MNQDNHQERFPSQCIRHEIDPLLVMDQINRKISRINEHREQWFEKAKANLVEYACDVENGVADKNWKREPDSLEFVDSHSDSRIEVERNHYSRVRVIELPQPGKRFALVYGDEDDTAPSRMTGPFESFEKASEWFLNFGR